MIRRSPFSGSLFVFRSRRCDRLKVLYWDRDGYALWYNRLEEGTFRLPRVERDAAPVERRANELAMLLEGIDLRTLGRVRRFSRRAS
ncbi:MAG: IS66 family insertion sequence element accessory protein TnpB [Phycisphaerales bacterium]|nr:IS66 family insertion sequence element accessory protein TnpB [Phycisphaerales bacterium]